jgi:hypothetical protein
VWANLGETSINSTVVQAQPCSAVLIANPIVDFGVQAPLERALPAIACRSDTEDHNPLVFCAWLAGVVPADSVSIKFFLRRWELTISRSVGAGR